MTDSIALGADGQVNHTLAVLRAEVREGELSEHVHFLPGVDLYADPALQLGGHYRSTEGRILDFEARPAGQGDWCALHLQLPARDLRPFGVLGFAMRCSAPELQVLRPCIRSGTEEGFVDCFLTKHVLVRPEESSHVDAVAVADRPNLPLEAPWRELILFLPPHRFDLSVIDLRLFLV